MFVPKADRQQLLGILKATGSRERDVLYAAKTAYLQTLNGQYKNLPIVMYGVAVLCLIPIFTAPGAVVFVALGLWVRGMLKANDRACAEVLAEYLSSLARPAPAAAGPSPATAGG